MPGVESVGHVNILSTHRAELARSRATEATVYVDHPVHALYGHRVNIDVLNPALGPSARVALELTEETALALADAIHRAIASAPAGLASRDQ
jgi:hypothetical protein